MSDRTARVDTGLAGSADSAGSAVSAVPALRVAGNPSDEELAALVVVLSAVGGTDAPPATGRRSAWADPARRLVGVSPRAARRPATPGAGWRDSALPG